ncbi:spore germination protein [Sporosarcina sp. Te-1]|uniref:spore germination protein n=1 Tax=Sporosarcina sp. Te-1 TaxID=2818390 RepID=UPI001A9D6E82|nr:spore germination protein [Sporosarcina sp. Te-1]QTD40480.1 spore germination protein [Sporosarcina sp. Te-1]
MQSAGDAITVETLKILFQKSADVLFQEYIFNEQKVVFVVCDAMVDQQLLHGVVVKRVQEFCETTDPKQINADVLGLLHVPGLQQVKHKSDVITLLYTGNVILYFENSNEIFSSNIANKPNRKPEETTLEVSVKGPRDDFIEDVSTNIAIIRKRIPTNSLCVEKFELGKRSKTTVALLYFNDVVDKNTLQTIQKRLNQVDMDIVFSGDLLMEKIEKSPLLFPLHDYTGRPDHAVQSLARGRFLLFVDGTSYGIITPANIALLLKSGEDNEYSILFSSFERLLRFSGIVIGAMLPAFWLALTTFHQNQLPLQLLATVVVSSTGLPFPGVIEMLLMLFMFELFREAGLRLPAVIGGTISVVGGLIIGESAINAGITSPAMIVVIASSTIATYTLVNQSLVTAVSVIRLFFILLTAFFGLFGFFISLYFTIVYLAKIKVFGVPYLNFTSDLSLSSLSKTFLRLSPKQYNKRPKMLNPRDKTRSKEADHE